MPTLSSGDRWLITATVALLTEGDSYDRQVAIARMIRAAMERDLETASTVCLSFSCWDSQEPRRTVLSGLFASSGWPAYVRAVADAFQ